MHYRTISTSAYASSRPETAPGSTCYVPTSLQMNRPPSRTMTNGGHAAPSSAFSSGVAHYNSASKHEVYSAPPLAAASFAAAGTPSSCSHSKISSQIAAMSAAASNSTPVKRKPLGDATFLTQAQRSTPMHQCSPVKLPPTPSRSPAVSTASTSLLRGHPLQHHRPLLVLDLDETLVHASVEVSDGNHDVAFVVEMNQQRINVFVKIRPFAREFLRRVATQFEVCVFTASLAPYADRVVDYLDPTGQLVHHRLYREHCTNVDGNYVKDMNLMGRSLERVAIVDNSPVAYSFHPENAIPILSWFDDRSDRELLELFPLLDHFAQGKDFFTTRRKFRVSA